MKFLTLLLPLAQLSAARFASTPISELRKLIRTAEYGPVSDSVPLYNQVYPLPEGPWKKLQNPC